MRGYLFLRVNLMDYIPDHFKLSFNPTANPEAVVTRGEARFTVLTPRMIRMEWSPTQTFEDRPSQAFWFRSQPVPEFSVQETGGKLVIETSALRLHYRVGQPYAADTLWIERKEAGQRDPHPWHHGDPDPGNLLGSARTVDNVDGATPLSLGLLSRSGWSVVDDSSSLVFDLDCWLEPRGTPEGQLDLYYLGYGHDYLGCLREFNLVSGSVPMVPRYILGNWWSRYWEYTHTDLTGLMDDFQRYQIPLSVCIIDMDWHITKTGNKSSGWTGYTWNRELFPDPAATLRYLHEKGLKVALNLHPALGVYPHEEQYEAMCEAVGQDPSKGEPVEFDITNPRFVDAYFRILHHPQEEMGVDFWWMDWQQGFKTRLSGLDPLWWLNHLHFLDLGRHGDRRSFIFSRWAGLGNQRYPIGFSGDSVVSWASLAFQPYYTATSSNVNYGWWSHDIGGHFQGTEEAELYTRWVQMGVFLPVLRLHSTKNPYHERRPWGYDANTLEAARSAMQLRHSMIPYLYSMAWRYHTDGVPMITPMYYSYPEREEAYACPNQYQFGTQLIAAPFITPADPDTQMSRSAAWLPDGDWYHFFTGEYFPGGGWQAVYGGLNDIPVFARAGAIVPQSPKVGWGGIETPERLIVQVFPGADGRFDLYDDEGNSMDYLQGAYAITPMRLDWTGQRAAITIGPAEGDRSQLPPNRQYDLLFRALAQPENVEVRFNGEVVDSVTSYDPARRTLAVSGLRLDPGGRLEVILTGGSLAERADRRAAALQRMVETFRLNTVVKADLVARLPEVLAQPASLGRFLPALTDSQARALFEVLTGAGMDYSEATGEGRLVLWNNHADPKIHRQTAAAMTQQFWRPIERYPWTSGVLPRFEAHRVKDTFGEEHWHAEVNYYGVITVREGKK